MSAQDRAAAARARMAQINTEMNERRAIRGRNAKQVRDKALESLRKQGPMVEQAARHFTELARRRQQAGGWGTGKTERDPDNVLDLRAEDERDSDVPYAGTRVSTPATAESEVPDAVDTDAPEPQPAATAAPAAVAQPVRVDRRPRHAREVLDDEEDFSNQSSWMRNQ